MPPSDIPPPAERPQFLLGWFALALLLPPTLVLLAAMSEQPGDMPALIAFGGSLVGGFICGWLLARRLARSAGGRVLATLGFTVLFGAVILGLCFAGCFGGYAVKGQI